MKHSRWILWIELSKPKPRALFVLSALSLRLLLLWSSNMKYLTKDSHTFGSRGWTKIQNWLRLVSSHSKSIKQLLLKSRRIRCTMTDVGSRTTMGRQSLKRRKVQTEFSDQTMRWISHQGVRFGAYSTAESCRMMRTPSYRHKKESNRLRSPGAFRNHECEWPMSLTMAIHTTTSAVLHENIGNYGTFSKRSHTPFWTNYSRSSHSELKKNTPHNQTLSGMYPVVSRSEAVLMKGDYDCSPASVSMPPESFPWIEFDNLGIILRHIAAQAICASYTHRAEIEANQATTTSRRFKSRSQSRWKQCLRMRIIAAENSLLSSRPFYRDP